MFSNGNNSPGKTSQEKLKNAFKEQFRTEIADYISDLDLNFQVSGRSSRLSNYSNQKAPIRVELSESLLRHFDTVSFENNISNFDKKHPDKVNSKNENEKSNLNYYNDEINSDSIVPLDDIDLITNNVSIMPIFDDSSDSQASKVYQKSADTKPKKTNKNTKKIINNRSKSPSTKNKFSLKVPSSKQIPRSKSPSVLPKQKAQPINRRKDVYTTGFNRPSSKSTFEQPKPKSNNKIEKRGITQSLLLSNRHQTIPNNQKSVSTHKLSPKHKIPIPSPKRSPSPQNIKASTLNNSSNKLNNLGNNNINDGTSNKFNNTINSISNDSSNKLNPAVNNSMANKLNNAAYKEKIPDKSSPTNRKASPRKSRIPSPRRSPQKTSLSPQNLRIDNKTRPNLSEPIRSSNDNFELAQITFTNTSDSSDVYVIPTSSIKLKSEGDSDDEQPFLFSPKAPDAKSPNLISISPKSPEAKSPNLISISPEIPEAKSPNLISISSKSPEIIERTEQTINQIEILENNISENDHNISSQIFDSINETKNDDSIENLLSFSPVQDAKTETQNTTNATQSNVIDDLLDLSVIPINNNSNNFSNDLINITPEKPKKTKCNLIIDNPIFKSITTSPPLIVDIPLISETNEMKNDPSKENYKPKTLAIEEWTTSFSTDVSQNGNQQNSEKLISQFAEDLMNLDNLILTTNTTETKEPTKTNVTLKPETSIASTDALILDLIGQNEQNSPTIDLISFIETDLDSSGKVQIGQVKETTPPKSTKTKPIIDIHPSQDDTIDKFFAPQPNMTHDSLTNNDSNLLNQKNNPQVVNINHELSLELFENDMLGQLDQYTSEAKPLSIAFDTLGLSNDEIVENETDSEEDVNRINLNQNENDKLQKEIEEAKKNKNFPSGLVKEIVLSLTNVEKDLSEPSLPIDEDFIFSFQERICSLFEVEVVTNDNHSTEIFPFDLNQYVHNDREPKQYQKEGNECQKGNENDQEFIEEKIMEEAIQNHTQPKNHDLQVNDGIPKPKRKEKIATKSEIPLKSKMKMNSLDHNVQIEQIEKPSQVIQPNPKLQVKESRLSQMAQSLKAKKTPTNTLGINDGVHESSNSTEKKKKDLNLIPSVVRKSSPGNTKKQMYSSPSSNKNQFSSSLHSNGPLIREEVNLNENSENTIPKRQNRIARLKTQASYGPQKTAALNLSTEEIDNKQSPTKLYSTGQVYSRIIHHELQTVKKKQSPQKVDTTQESLQSRVQKTPNTKKILHEIPKVKISANPPRNRNSSHDSSPMQSNIKAKPRHNDSKNTIMSPSTIPNANQVLDKTKPHINMTKSPKIEYQEEEIEGSITPNKNIKAISKTHVSKMRKLGNNKTSLLNIKNDESSLMENSDPLSNQDQVNQIEFSLTSNSNESSLIKKKNADNSYYENDFEISDSIVHNNSTAEQNEDDNEQILDEEPITTEPASKTCLIRANITKTKPKFSLKKPKKKLDEK